MIAGFDVERFQASPQESDKRPCGLTLFRAPRFSNRCSDILFEDFHTDAHERTEPSAFDRGHSSFVPFGVQVGHDQAHG